MNEERKAREKRQSLKDRIMRCIEERVDSADCNGTIEGLTENILEQIEQ